MNERTLRARMLLGEEAMEKLAGSHVAVFGLGGVGSWCAEALARAGVGRLTLIDQDTVGESNINRQLCALGSTVGFGFIICLISLFREMAISGSVWGHPLGFTLRLPEAGAPFSAFILLGFLSALLQWTRRRISAYFCHKEETNS